MNCLTYWFPSFKRNLQRTLTTPLSPVLFVPDQGEVPPGARPVSYLRFHARVGHNSRFIGLSDDDYEELGGVEYHALTVLLWIVSGVSSFYLHSTHQSGLFTKLQMPSITSSHY
jgi:hypothetical protein